MPCWELKLHTGIGWINKYKPLGFLAFQHQLTLGVGIYFNTTLLYVFHHQDSIFITHYLGVEYFYTPLS